MTSRTEATSRERLAGVSETIEAILAAGGVPGAVVAIGQGGAIIHEASYGMRDIRKGLRPNTKTLFGLASITKTFTSAAISILVDEGKLDWTTPIRTILPGLNSTVPRITQGLTIVDLLSHQTGLSSRNEWWYGSDSVLLIGREQELPLFNSLRPVAEFRSKYNYSNYGYGLAGLIIEKLSGLSFADFLQQKLLDPLRMQSTTTRSLDHRGGNIAIPYATLDDLSPSALPQPAVTGETVMTGAQAVRSNAEDLIKWGHALMSAAQSESKSGNHHTPGSPLKFVSNMMAKRITRRPGEFDQSYGLGFHRNQLPCDFVGVGPNAMFVEKMPTIHAKEGHPTVLLHPGSMAGYYTYFNIIPELDITLVVLTNAISLGDPAGWINMLLLEKIFDSPSQTDYISLAKEAAESHVKRYPDLLKRLQDQRKSQTPPREIDNYVGCYKHPDREWIIEIRKNQQESLEMAWQGLDTQVWSMSHYEEDTFLFLPARDDEARRGIFTFADENDHRLIFETNDDGAVDSVVWPVDSMLPHDVLRFHKITTA